MNFLSKLVVFLLIVMAILGTYLLFKRFNRLTEADSHSDYELRYMAPGKPDEVLAKLEKADYVDGFYSGFIPDGQILMVWRSEWGGRKQYQVQLTEKGNHTQILLTLYSFSLGARKLNMDDFMRAKVQGQRVKGG